MGVAVCEPEGAQLAQREDAILACLSAVILASTVRSRCVGWLIFRFSLLTEFSMCCHITRFHYGRQAPKIVQMSTEGGYSTYSFSLVTPAEVAGVGLHQLLAMLCHVLSTYRSAADLCQAWVLRRERELQTSCVCRTQENCTLLLHVRTRLQLLLLIRMACQIAELHTMEQGLQGPKIQPIQGKPLQPVLILEGMPAQVCRLQLLMLWVSLGTCCMGLLRARAKLLTSSSC